MNKSITKEILDWIEIIAIALLVAFLIRNFLFQPYRVQMGSMLPTLKENNLIIVNKITYRLNDPKRGDIVVFRPPNGSKVFYVKRIVALPGETIEIRNGELLINGIPLEEDYISGATPGVYGPLTLGRDEYFVMGDHRNNSLDSREFGPISKESIIGKAALVFWPPSAFAVLSDKPSNK